MKVGLVRRRPTGEGAAGNYLKDFAGSLSTAGHTPVLFTSRDTLSDGFSSGKIHSFDGTTPAAFAASVEGSNPRRECDFLFSFEPGVACDCLLAGDGVQRARMARWSPYQAAGGWWQRRRRANCDRELLALEANSFQPDVTKIIVVGSRMVKDEIVRHYNFPGDRIQVIPPGIPLPDPTVIREARIETRRQLGLADEDFVIYCGGSGLSELEFRFAIEGINCVNLSQPVLLAGCSKKRGVYPHSARTRFVGPADQDLSHLATADVFLQPSVYDPFSQTGLTALARGLPVITTRANGISEIIEPGVEGEILPEPSDAEAIARAIEVWCDPAKRLAIKPRVRSLAAKFDPASNWSALLALLGHFATTLPSA